MDLGVERKGDAVVRAAEGFDFLQFPGFLSTEVVAGESQHIETAVAVGLLQFLQALVLGSETATTGHIDDQQHLASQIA